MGVVYSLYDHRRKEFYCIGKRTADVFRTDAWEDCGGIDCCGTPHSCHPARRYATVEDLIAAIFDDFNQGIEPRSIDLTLSPEVADNLRRIARGAFAFMQDREKVCIHDDCSYDEPDGYVEINDDGGKKL